MSSLKVSGEKGKALLANLNTTPMGKSFELPALIPALSTTPVQAFVVEKEDNFWTLECRWHGINIGDVQASVSNGTIELEAI